MVVLLGPCIYVQGFFFVRIQIKKKHTLCWSMLVEPKYGSTEENRTLSIRASTILCKQSKLARYLTTYAQLLYVVRRNETKKSTLPARSVL